MKKGIIAFSALLVVPSINSYQTTIENATSQRVEITLRYKGCARRQDKFLVDSGKTRTEKHGLCCLRSFDYIPRSGSKSGVKYVGEPIPTRLLPWKSCKKNHFIIREIPEDNSLYMEDTTDKGEKGYYLYINNKTNVKIRMSIAYSTSDCEDEQKIVDAGKAMVMNTGTVRAGVYLGKIKPWKNRCCILKIAMSPVEGAQAGKWFEFVPSKKQFMYGGHCGTLNLDVTENPDGSLFIGKAK